MRMFCKECSEVAPLLAPTGSPLGRLLVLSVHMFKLQFNKEYLYDWLYFPFLVTKRRRLAGSEAS